MREFLKKYFKGDAVVWIVYGLLCFYSLIEGYSATSSIAYKYANHSAPFLRHAFLLLMGFGLLYFTSRINKKLFHLIPYIILPLAFILLIYVTVNGRDVNNSSRWIEVFGISIQPSELAKFGMVAFIADRLSKKSEDNDSNPFKSIIIVLSLFCLIIAPENLSTAVMLFGIGFVMMFIGRIAIKKLLLTLLVPLALVTIVLVLAPYLPKSAGFHRAELWRARVVDVFEKETDEEKYKIDDSNYQVAHAKIAVARGGALGQFPGRSQERDFLPLAFSDFIYAIIIEEMGWLFGGIILMGLYLILMFRAGIIAKKCKVTYYAYLVLGYALLVVSQAFISMAVSVNLGPVTGQPLPLISRGGTSILMTSIYLGIILNISREITNASTETNIEENTASKNN